MKLTLLLLSSLVLTSAAVARTLYVSPTAEPDGDGTTSRPYKTATQALTNAVAGDVILLSGGAYRERLTIPRSGTNDKPITLKAKTGERPIFDLKGITGKHGIYIRNRSFIRIEGLEFKNNLNVRDGSLIRIEGYGSGVQILRNSLHTTTGSNAMAITVYGDHGSLPIRNLKIEGNVIRNIAAARSEALVLNGNVDGFTVNNNTVTDINNIGIDFIGGEGVCPNATNDQARNGICRGNRVTRANSIYGGGYAGGIYVDGGKNIVIEENTVTESDLGIEVGAENKGLVTTGITVRNNRVIGNEKCGIIFGGYDSSVGRVKNCEFLNNLVKNNDTLKTGLGQLCIQFASNNTIRGNTFITPPGTPFYYSENGNVENRSNDNHFESSSTRVNWVWINKEYTSLSKYQSGSGQDSRSTFRVSP